MRAQAGNAPSAGGREAMIQKLTPQWLPGGKKPQSVFLLLLGVLRSVNNSVTFHGVSLMFLTQC